MRLLTVVVLSGWFLACRRPTEVRGLYAGNDGTGDFIPCDKPHLLLHVSDSTLATRYRLTATAPHQLVFVRLRGIRTDSGSIYWSSHHFLVQQVVEVRVRRSHECPDAARPVAQLFARSPS